MNQVCSVFQRCGGCHLLSKDYSEQLKIKEKLLLDSLSHYSNLSNLVPLSCVPSPRIYAYRNKVQLPVVPGIDGAKMGLYARGSHELVPMDDCLVHSALAESILKEAKKLLISCNIQGYCERTRKGDLRYLMIRTAEGTGEALVTLISNGEGWDSIRNFARMLMERCPQVVGVVENINKRRDNVILGRNHHLLEGRAHLIERILDKKFRVLSNSFLQVNPFQAAQLYSAAIEWADLKADDVFIDAYCGVGTLSILASEHVKQVYGIECVEEAIECARNNAELNQLDNCTFQCGKSEHILPQFTKADIILLNPPRKGCELSVLNAAVSCKPRSILYISCNPKSLSKDLSFLLTKGANIDRIQTFDLFPHTLHVETLVQISF